MSHPQLLSWSEVHARVRLSRSVVYEMMRRGDFPRAVKTGPAQTSRVFWKSDEVDAWIESRNRAEYNGVGRPPKKIPTDDEGTAVA